MDDAFLMSGFHPLGNLTADFQGLLYRHWTFDNTLGQAFACVPLRNTYSKY